MFYGSAAPYSTAPISHQAGLPGGNLWPPYTQIWSKLRSINTWGGWTGGPGEGRHRRGRGGGRRMQITPGNYLDHRLLIDADLINRSLHISLCRTFRQGDHLAAIVTIWERLSPSEIGYHHLRKIITIWDRLSPSEISSTSEMGSHSLNTVLNGGFLVKWSCSAK